MSKKQLKGEITMFTDLPETIKTQVEGYLLANDFPTAKQIYDQWIRGQSECLELDSMTNELTLDTAE